jgi:hypothetical protein
MVSSFFLGSSRPIGGRPDESYWLNCKTIIDVALSDMPFDLDLVQQRTHPAQSAFTNRRELSALNKQHEILAHLLNIAKRYLWDSSRGNGLRSFERLMAGGLSCCRFDEHRD